MSKRKRTDADRVIRILLERIPDLFEVHRVILFGSRARGDVSSESDFDFLIVAETDLRPAMRSALVYRSLRDIHAPMDIIVVTPEEFESRSKLKSTVIYSAASEGKTIYEAA